MSMNNQKTFLTSIQVASLLMLCAAHTVCAISQDSVQAIRADAARAAVYVCGNSTGNLGGEMTLPEMGFG